MDVERIAESLRKSGIEDNLICRIVSCKELRDYEIRDLFQKLQKEFEEQGFHNKGASRMAIERISELKNMTYGNVRSIIYSKIREKI